MTVLAPQEMQLAEKYRYGDGFQFKAIALALRVPGFLAKHIDVFRSEWFERDHLITIAWIVTSFYRQYNGIPTREALTAWALDYAKSFGLERTEDIRCGLLGWIEAAYQADLSDEEYISSLMLRFGRSAAMKAALRKGIDLLQQDGDLDTLRNTFDEALRVGAIRETGINFYTAAPNLPQQLQQDLLYGQKNRVTTGIKALDSRIMGGPGAGELVVIAGPPGRGKSTLMVNMAKAAGYFFARQGTRQKMVVHITLELKELDVALMLASCLTGVPKDAIVDGSGAAQYGPAITTQLQTLGDRFRIRYFSPGSVSVNDIRWFLHNLQCDIGLLIVDYADKLKGGEDDRYRGMGAIYDGLIAIGDRFGVPVITGSQVNREWSYEDVIDMRGVAESWLKAANCDLMLTLCQTVQEHQAGIMRLYPAKVRRGAWGGQIYCQHVGAMAFVREMSIDEAKAAETHFQQHAEKGANRDDRRRKH